MVEPDLHRRVMAVRQDLIYSVSKGRVKTPKHVSLVMTIKNLTGSSQVVTILNRFGHTISYNELLELESALAQKQVKKKEKEGVFLPSNILPNVFTTFAGTIMISVTQPIYESRMNWVTASRPSTEASPAPMPAILMPSSGASSQPPRCPKSRRRRRKAVHAANQNSASRQADLATPAERTANENSARRRATQPRSAANDLPEMKSTPVEHPHSFTSSLLTQPPISAANQNAGISSRWDHSEFWRLYKPAQSDPRKDLTATHSRDNISGFGLSSPALKQSSTKPFSGLPSRPQLTSPHREAGEAYRERPGIVYPLLPRAASPDTRLQVEAALPEAAAFERRTRPPTVLDIKLEGEDSQTQGPRRRQSRKRRSNRSTGVYRPSKRSPPRGRWCD